MRRTEIRRALIAGGAVAMCCPAMVLAQEPARLARVVIAMKATEKGREHFRAAFAEHGWVEGRNLRLSYVEILGVPKAEAEARARAVIESRPDAILMLFSHEVALFQRLTKDIPFVFYNLAIDPAKIGLVESLRRPGGNITGTSHNYDQLWTKVLGILKEIRPALKRVDILGLDDFPRDINEAFPRWGSVFRETWQAARDRLGIEIRIVLVPKEATLAIVVDAIRKSKPDALVIPYPWPIPGFIAFLEKERIPACGFSFAFVRDGGLLGLGFDFEEGEKQAVAIVAHILRGESPATIPVYESTRYGFAVNLRTARAMNLTIPASIRIQATEVVE